MTVTASYYLYQPMVSGSINPEYPYWPFPFENFPTDNYIDGGNAGTVYPESQSYDGNFI